MRYKVIFTLIFLGILFKSCADPSRPNYQYFPNMYESIGYDTYSESDAFNNNIEAQIPVEGTIARGWEPYDYPDSNEGYEAAKRCALSLIAQAKKFCDGDLNKVKSCIKLTGYVNSVPEFTEQPKVINGASDLIFLIFEDNGKHSRAAVSANSLPLGVAVEVDAIFEII